MTQGVLALRHMDITAQGKEKHGANVTLQEFMQGKRGAMPRNT